MLTLYGSFAFSALSPLLMPIGLAALPVGIGLIPIDLLHSFDISYGAYLYHGLVINLLVASGASQSFSPLIYFSASYSLGVISWIFVEKPFLSFKANVPKFLMQDS